MAQSPKQFSQLAAGTEYLRSWDALGALLAKGYSFSGHERDCAFLNLGGAPAPTGGKTRDAAVPSFACASGALGLDQIDDSRSIIPVDWDGDGDLDLWYANRTAPRLRFFRNEMATGSRWLAVKLEGKTANRDAIGARVELTLGDAEGRERTLWRRLRAGDGFLSQTPKILHFGFRSGEKITRLVVRWPGPSTVKEVVEGLEPNRTYAITESAGARPIPARAGQTPLAVGPATLPEPSEHVRAPLVNRVPVPKLEFVDFEGKPQSVGGGELAQPTLVLLWASWCAPCLKEMKALTEQAAALKAKNVRLLALSVDTAKADATPADLAAARSAIASLNWPFDAGITHEGALRTLALIETQALYPERPLPLPSSYLLDPKGRMAVLYHGPVEAKQLIQDATFAANPPETVEEMKTVVFPFPGRDAKSLFPLSSQGLAQVLREAGYRDEARAELEQSFRVLDQNAKDGSQSAALAALCWRLADLEDEAGDADKAIAAYHKAISYAPDDARLHLAFAATLWKAKRIDDATAAFEKARTLAKGATSFHNQIGKVWQTLGDHAKARDAFAAAVAAAPGDLTSQFNLAVSRQLSGDSVGAIADYEAILRKKPDLLDAASNLAWILATSRNQKVRHPARALELADKVNAATSRRSPAALDTLAAAQAATGDFAAATATAEAALVLARAMNESAIATESQKHLESFRARKPWVE